MNLNDLTIIITTFKSDEKINSCLNSINKKVKVIIIENSGSQRFKDSVEKKYQNVECIISKENLGYSKANNLGLKRVNTRYALVLNPDTILETNAQENFLKSASLESQVSAISDDIAYNNHDIEDGIRASLFSISQLAEVPFFKKIFEKHKKKIKYYRNEIIVSQIIREAILQKI